MKLTLVFAGTVLLNAPLFAVAVWSSPSRFVQVTVSPTLTVVDGGVNTEFWMMTVWFAARAALGSRAAIAMTNPATRNGRLRRIR